MKSLFKSLNSTQPTPLVSLFAVVTTILAGVFVFQKFVGSPYFDFGPIMLWIAIAIPAGIFGAIFLQLRAGARAEKNINPLPQTIVEIQSSPRLSKDSRHSGKPKLDRPFPDKDPFENL